MYKLSPGAGTGGRLRSPCARQTVLESQAIRLKIPDITGNGGLLVILTADLRLEPQAVCVRSIRKSQAWQDCA